MGRNYDAFESRGDTVWNVLENNLNEINVDDTIINVTQNQTGYAMYRVVLDNTGKKTLKLVDSYDHMENPRLYTNEDLVFLGMERPVMNNNNNNMYGGKKKRLSKKRFNKQTLVKRKTLKRKTSKKKLTKRNTKKVRKLSKK